MFGVCKMFGYEYKGSLVGGHSLGCRSVIFSLILCDVSLLLCCDYWFRVSTMRSIPHHSMIRDFLEPHFCVSYEWFYCQGPHPQHPVMWDLHHIPIVMDQKLHSFFTLIRPIRSPLGIFLHTVFLQWPMVPHRWCTFLSRILVFTCMIWFVGFLIQKVLDRRWLHAVDLRLVIFHNPSKKTYS